MDPWVGVEQIMNSKTSEAKACSQLEPVVPRKFAACIINHFISCSKLETKRNQLLLGISSGGNVAPSRSCCDASGTVRLSSKRHQSHCNTKMAENAPAQQKEDCYNTLLFHLNHLPDLPG